MSELTFPSDALVLAYLCKKREPILQSGFMRELRGLCDRLYAEGVHVRIDFNNMGDIIFSNILAEELTFLLSFGLIAQCEDKLAYYITDLGRRKIEDKRSVFYRGVAPEATLAVERCSQSTK